MADADPAEKPDLLFVSDAALGTNPVSTLAALRDAYPASRLIALAQAPDSKLGEATWLTGIGGCLMTSMPKAEFIEAVRLILAGIPVIAPQAMAGSLEAPPPRPIALDGLSPGDIALFDVIPVPVAILQDDSYLYVNQAAADFVDCDRDELRGRPFWDAIADVDREAIRSLCRSWQKRVEGSPLPRLALSIHTSLGTIRQLDSTLRQIRIGGRPAVLLVGMETRSADELPDPPQLLRKLDPARLPRADGLTARQHTILRLVAMGFSNRKIAEAVGIRETTVKVHLYAIMGRLGAANRTAAVAIARRDGLIHAD